MRIDKEQDARMDTSHTCPQCGSKHLRYLGLQWWPVDLIHHETRKVCYEHHDHPGEAALELYLCEGCQTSRLFPPSSR